MGAATAPFSENERRDLTYAAEHPFALANTHPVLIRHPPTISDALRGARARAGAEGTCGARAQTTQAGATARVTSQAGAGAGAGAGARVRAETTHPRGTGAGVGELVWAKIIGYPWWPARVTAVTPLGTAVQFFDCTVATLNDSCISPWHSSHVSKLAKNAAQLLEKTKPAQFKSWQACVDMAMMMEDVQKRNDKSTDRPRSVGAFLTQLSRSVGKVKEELES